MGPETGGGDKRREHFETPPMSLTSAASVGRKNQSAGGASPAMSPPARTHESDRLLGERLRHPMLLRKGELHRLIRIANAASIPQVVEQRLSDSTCWAHSSIARSSAL